MLQTKHSGKAFLIMTLTQLILSYIVLLAFNNKITDVTIAILLACNSATMLIGAFIATLGTGYNPFKERKKASALQFLLTGAIVIGVIFIGLALTNFFVAGLYATGYRYKGASLDYTTPFGIIMSILLMVVLAPVCEEILMRGTILDGLKESGERKAILLTGLFFMLMHESPMQTVHQFILGAMLAYIVIVTRSFWLAIFGHVLNNVITLGTVLIEANFTSSGVTDVVVLDLTNILLLIGFFIAGCVIVYFATRALLTVTAKKDMGENSIIIPRRPTLWLNDRFLACYTGRSEKKGLDIYVYVAIVVGVAFWIYALVTGYLPNA